jgi:CheY-like chemotaxis protein
MQALGCESGREAFPLIRSQRPRLVVLDIQMPYVDGVQVFRLLRADPVTLHIPVIFLTANAAVLAQRVPDYQQMGGRVVPKPIDVGELIAAVEELLNA